MYIFIVKDILSLMLVWDRVVIYVDGYSYLFEEDTIPDCVLYAKVVSIDNPVFKVEVCPLGIKINSDSLEDMTVNEFKEKYKDYLI